MIIMFIISVWGGDPVKVDTYYTMEQCQAAITKTKAEPGQQAWFYRQVCVPSAKAVEGK